MKICMFTGYRYPSSLNEPIVCGDLRGSFNLSRELSKFGLDVSVIARGNDTDMKYQELDGVKIYRYRSEFPFLFKDSFDLSFRRFSVFKSTLPCDVIYTTTPLMESSKLKAPLFYVSHGLGYVINLGYSPSDLFTRGGTKVRNYVMYRTWRKAKKIITVMGTERDKVVRLGFPSNKVEIIHNGVDVERYKPMKEKETIKKHFNVEGKKVILSVSRFSPEKGLHLVVRATKQIVKRCPSTIVILAGVKGRQSSSYLSQLMKEVKRYGVQDHIRIITNVPENSLPQLYNIADVFVTFSTGYDPIPNTILEASACGIPVISTDFEARREEVIDGVTGVLVPEGDINTLLKEVVSLLSDEKRRIKMGKAGREFIINHKNIRNVAENFVELFKIYMEEQRYK